MVEGEESGDARKIEVDGTRKEKLTWKEGRGGVYNCKRGCE